MTQFAHGRQGVIKTMADLKALVSQIIRFGLVGVLNTVITQGLIFLLQNFAGVHYVASNVVGYAAGITNSYICNRIWVFKSRGSIRTETMKFLVVTGACYLLQLGFLVILKEGFNVGKNAAQLISMVFYSCLNFVGQRTFTYSDREQ